MNWIFNRAIGIAGEYRLARRSPPPVNADLAFALTLRRHNESTVDVLGFYATAAACRSAAAEVESMTLAMRNVARNRAINAAANVVRFPATVNC
jgi:uncharacterized protein YcsI (UPF0317 family)